MWSTLAEGGAHPVVISESGGSKSDMGGGAVMVILLFLLLIVVAAFAMFGRREPIVERNSGLAELLPAMMVMTSTTQQRQNVDVNSHNVNASCGNGPSNFQLYQQGVATNDNVFVQSCQTRELLREDGNETRNLINDNRMHDLELALADRNAQIISLNNQIATERQFSALTSQSTANFNSLQQQIYTLSGQVVKEPIPAYCVTPYGAYRPGFVNTFREDRDRCERC